MKLWLPNLLICPECLPEELSLDIQIQNQDQNDIISATLGCNECGTEYPVKNGVALILPVSARGILNEDTGYNSNSMVSSYLWSHFCDLLNDPDATEAYHIWSSSFRDGSGTALDIGCSVGRLAFEMSLTHNQVVGIDTSKAFIQKARELMREKRLDFDLIIEGNITESKTIEFNNGWQYDKTEFIVADAMALPFRQNSFNTIASINILEKVPNPMTHFSEVNRLMNKENAMFVFSDPFSWDESVSSPETWISGKNDGKYAGRGIDNLEKILTGFEKIIDPPMSVIEKKDVAWKIRKTQNLWEYITSQMIIGSRT